MSSFIYLFRKMAKWNNCDSGILRKNKPKDNNYDDLLVFGYACKLFRDDDKAQFIDQGKHLIPWMGDEKLKIDRYDCRGALSDVSSYESSREGFDAMRWLGLSESERKLEQLCDKERYYSLHINEEEEEMYKEEEHKRQKTNAFQYSYDVPTEPEVATVEGPEAHDEGEDEYIPPPGLDVPVDIEIPKTVKESARIEKTASFVCKQGPQMEILIKAKQGDNPQFSFLNQNDRLYKFYRHVLAAFKNGRYQPTEVKKTEETTESSSEVEGNGHYLHPILLSTNLQQPDAVNVPTIPYKPSANCAYSQLVNRIQQGNNQTNVEPVAMVAPECKLDDVLAPSAAEVPTCYAQMTYEQQQYYQYYYASQYYEYYKQMAQYQQTITENATDSMQNVQMPDFQLDPNLQAYLQHMAYTQYQQNTTTNNSYAQIVSNVNKDTNPYTASVPILPPEKSEYIPPEPPTPSVVVVAAKKPPLLSLAQYGTDSEDEDQEEEEQEEDHREVFKIPVGETQIVIDKMAVYVSKNGEKFEDIVRAKGDPRFEFLNDEHEFNKYYREKIRDLKAKQQIEEKQVVIVTPAVDDTTVNRHEVVAKEKEKKVIAPVSFSIKKPKDEPPKEIKSALPVEESDEEDEGVGEHPVVNGEEPPPTPPEDTNKNGIVALDVDDPILEMIDLTDDIEERKDAKRAEDRIKDKLAAAAREKLASVSRDRALQLERKKKAAAFLKLKSATTHEESTEIPVVHLVQDSDDVAEPKKSSKSKKKKSHKRKRSRSKHEGNCAKTKKKSKKRRKQRSSSESSCSSNS